MVARNCVSATIPFPRVMRYRIEGANQVKTFPFPTLRNNFWKIAFQLKNVSIERLFHGNDSQGYTLVLVDTYEWENLDTNSLLMNRYQLGLVFKLGSNSDEERPRSDGRRMRTGGWTLRLRKLNREENSSSVDTAPCQGPIFWHPIEESDRRNKTTATC